MVKIDRGIALDPGGGRFDSGACGSSPRLAGSLLQHQTVSHEQTP